MEFSFRGRPAWILPVASPAANRFSDRAEFQRVYPRHVVARRFGRSWVGGDPPLTGLFSVAGSGYDPRPMKRYTPHLWLFFVLVGSSAARPVRAGSPPARADARAGAPLLQPNQVNSPAVGPVASPPQSTWPPQPPPTGELAPPSATTMPPPDQPAYARAKSVHACPGSAGLSCAGAVAAGR